MKQYTCPMHPEVVKNEPGNCPGCGMALILKETEASHKDHEMAMTNPQIAKKMEQDMRRRFWVSFLLSVPIVFYSPLGISVFSAIGGSAFGGKLTLPTQIG